MSAKILQFPTLEKGNLRPVKMTISQKSIDAIREVQRDLGLQNETSAILAAIGITQEILRADRSGKKIVIKDDSLFSSLLGKDKVLLLKRA